MTQVVLNISNKKKWDALKAILDQMKIDYFAQDSTEIISERELELLHQAENDKENGKVNTYINHRDILGL